MEVRNMLNEKNYKLELKVFEENTKNMFKSLEEDIKQKTDKLNKELNEKLIQKLHKSFELKKNSDK
jgi:hypothetical protein